VDHPNRGARWRRIRAESRPETDRGNSSGPQLRPPPEPLLQIQVTFRLPRRLSWLLAGIAIGHLLLPCGAPENASLLLRVLS
jgi:hypothetical protein